MRRVSSSAIRQSRKVSAIALARRNATKIDLGGIRLWHTT